MKIGIIIGSTRPGRNGESVAKWVFDIAKKRTDAEFELVDLLDYNLPLLDESIPPSASPGLKEHTKKWAAKIASLDSFIFVTPEYNHSTSGALKNALDFLFSEWHNKACGFVSYGGMMGVRAVEHLRLIVAELKMADVRAQVGFSLRTDFENYKIFKPAAIHEKEIATMLDEVKAWGSALKSLRK